MKKDLVISGKISLSRQEVVGIVAKWIEEHHDLKVERVISLDKSEQPAKEFESLLLYVHQGHKDKLTKDFDGPKKISISKGFSRPNYGIGEVLHEILKDGNAVSFNDIWNDVRHQFPKLEQNRLKVYLSREAMVGFKVTVEKGVYQRKSIPIPMPESYGAILTSNGTYH